LAIKKCNQYISCFWPPPPPHKKKSPNFENKFGEYGSFCFFKKKIVNIFAKTFCEFRDKLSSDLTRGRAKTSKVLFFFWGERIT